MKFVMALAFILLTALPSFAQEILKHEPASGTMRDGTPVLVDNGKCPKGQVMEVTAGRISNRHGTAAPRGYRCVPRP